MTEKDEKTPDEQRDPRTYAIIGAAMEVHREMGCGFLEAVNQDAIEVVDHFYKEQQLPRVYRPDSICFKPVGGDVKALTRLGSVEEAQMINYLKATGCEIGLVLNFGTPSLMYRRFVLLKERQA